MRGWPVIDILQFARKQAQERRSVAVSELERLGGAVAVEEPGFQVQLDGFEDASGKPGLRLRVTGKVELTCQRCLEPMHLDISSDRSFLLAAREEDLPELSEEDDDIESLLASSPLDLMALVEDEILLQIPMAPKHRDGRCARPQWGGEGLGAGSAFGALGALMNTED